MRIMLNAANGARMPIATFEPVDNSLPELPEDDEGILLEVCVAIPADELLDVGWIGVEEELADVGVADTLDKSLACHAI